MSNSVNSDGIEGNCLKDTPATNVEFIGYLLLDTQPTLYPLHCPPAGLVEVGGSILLVLYSADLSQLQPELALVTYLSTLMIHSPAYESPETEVPVYVLILCTTPMLFLNLHWIWGKTGYDNVMHGVYDHASVASADEPETVIHLARHPSGYYVPVPELPAPELVPAPELLVPEVENLISRHTDWIGMLAASILLVNMG
ncbi:hypothetical protein F4604DRAFT_1681322 [Suillus subluteus]|nr:hypothetical protein F4604DRAFT_1681322 [Suillus subluteus]